MLNPHEVPAFIACKLPALKYELTHKQEEGICHAIQALTDYTKRMVLEHNLKMVENCIQVAERLYLRGNEPVRNAIENVFIYSFSSIWALCNIVEWRIIQSYMPSTLYMLYMKQLLKTGD